MYHLVEILFYCFIGFVTGRLVKRAREKPCDHCFEIAETLSETRKIKTHVRENHSQQVINNQLLISIKKQLNQIQMTNQEEVNLLTGIGDQLDAVKTLVEALEAAPTDSVPQNVQDALAAVKTKTDALTALIPPPPAEG